MNRREHRAIVRAYRDATFNGASHDQAIGVLVQAAQEAVSGGPRAVRQFMSAQGFPQDGAWCGEFAAAVVRSTGGTPPANPEVASNWRNFGTTTDTPHVGDVAVRIGRSSYNPGNRVETGGTGSHVTFVGGVDPRTGTFTGVGGNQGANRYQTATGQFPISGFEFRSPSLQQQHEAVAPTTPQPGSYGFTLEMNTPEHQQANWDLAPTQARYSDQNFDLGPRQYYDPVTQQVTEGENYAPSLDWSGIPQSPDYTNLSQFGVSPTVGEAMFNDANLALQTQNNQGLAYGNAPQFTSYKSPYAQESYSDIGSNVIGNYDYVPSDIGASPTPIPDDVSQIEDASHTYGLEGPSGELGYTPPDYGNPFEGAQVSGETWNSSLSDWNQAVGQYGEGGFGYDAGGNIVPWNAQQPSGNLTASNGPSYNYAAQASPSEEEIEQILNDVGQQQQSDINTMPEASGQANQAPYYGFSGFHPYTGGGIFGTGGSITGYGHDVGGGSFQNFALGRGFGGPGGFGMWVDSLLGSQGRTGGQIPAREFTWT